MTLLLPTLAVAFAAFCVWLTVRIVNRKERWAKWTLAGTLSLATLGVYFGAYLRIVVALPPPGLVPGLSPVPTHQIKMVPVYGEPLGQEFSEFLFAPANWLDRRMRPKMWMSDPLAPASPSEDSNPPQWPP
ncbi:MAG: hypothetical protein HY290_03755 [Planctomycetia bacterium]|nr:hypothetical protein [Planctomycetia bacterium]